MLQLKLLLQLLEMSAVALSSPTSPGAPSPHREYNFVLSGQSNMVGRAGLQNVGVDELIWAWNDASEMYAERMNLTGEAGSMDGRIQTLTADLDWTDGQARLKNGMGDKIFGVGPSIFFAQNFLQRIDELPQTKCVNSTSATVNLIESAKGASSLQDWWPTNRKTRYYENMMERIRAANVTIDALIWYQGETDAAKKSTAKTYAERFKEWTEIFTSDISDMTSSPFWIIVVKPIGSADKRPYIDIVRQQCEMAASEIPFAAVVDAAIYPLVFNSDTDTTPPGLRSDRLHLNLQAQSLMGQAISTVVFGAVVGGGGAVPLALGDVDAVERIISAEMLDCLDALLDNINATPSNFYATNEVLDRTVSAVLFDERLDDDNVKPQESLVHNSDVISSAAQSSYIISAAAIILSLWDVITYC